MKLQIHFKKKIFLLNNLSLRKNKTCTFSLHKPNWQARETKIGFDMLGSLKICGPVKVNEHAP